MKLWSNNHKPTSPKVLLAISNASITAPMTSTMNMRARISKAIIVAISNPPIKLLGFDSALAFTGIHSEPNRANIEGCAKRPKRWIFKYVADNIIDSPPEKIRVSHEIFSAWAVAKWTGFFNKDDDSCLTPFCLLRFWNLRLTASSKELGNWRFRGYQSGEENYCACEHAQKGPPTCSTEPSRDHADVQPTRPDYQVGLPHPFHG